MATDRANDLRAFLDFADLMLSRGGGDITLDEALSLWKSENRDEDRPATSKPRYLKLPDYFSDEDQPATPRPTEEGGFERIVNEAMAELRRADRAPEPPS